MGLLSINGEDSFTIDVGLKLQETEGEEIVLWANPSNYHNEEDFDFTIESQKVDAIEFSIRIETLVFFAKNILILIDTPKWQMELENKEDEKVMMFNTSEFCYIKEKAFIVKREDLKTFFSKIIQIIDLFPKSYE